jgi:hypothetical protein
VPLPGAGDSVGAPGINVVETRFPVKDFPEIAATEPMPSVKLDFKEWMEEHHDASSQ